MDATAQSTAIYSVAYYGDVYGEKQHRIAALNNNRPLLKHHYPNHSFAVAMLMTHGMYHQLCSLVPVMLCLGKHSYDLL